MATKTLHCRGSSAATRVSCSDLPWRKKWWKECGQLTRQLSGSTTFMSRPCLPKSLLTKTLALQGYCMWEIPAQHGTPLTGNLCFGTHHCLADTFFRVILWAEALYTQFPHLSSLLSQVSNLHCSLKTLSYSWSPFYPSRNFPQYFFTLTQFCCLLLRRPRMKWMP